MSCLANTVLDLLRTSGIDANRVAGNKKKGIVFLHDPNEVEHARRVLTASRLRVSGSGATLSVVADDTPDQDESEYKELIGSWKNFISRSGDAGFRKARRLRGIAREALRDHETVEAARQIVETVLATSRPHGSLRRFACRLQHSIRRARRTGDAAPIYHLMRKIARTETVKMRDQNQQKVGNTVLSRCAGQISDLYDSAYKYLQNIATERSWSPQDIRNSGKILGQDFYNWKDTLPDGVDEEDATTLFASASDALSHTFENGDSDGHVTGSRVTARTARRMFSSNSTLNVKHTKRQMLRIVELVIEHYAATKHPEDLERGDVVRFCRQRYPDYNARKVFRLLKTTVDNGIPKRGES